MWERVGGGLSSWMAAIAAKHDEGGYTEDDDREQDEEERGAGAALTVGAGMAGFGHVRGMRAAVFADGRLAGRIGVCH